MSINKDEAFDLWAATNIEPPKPEEKRKASKLVEQIAIMMANGNTGGEWNINYTEEQRQVWRDRAVKVVAMVERRERDEAVVDKMFGAESDDDATENS